MNRIIDGRVLKSAVICGYNNLHKNIQIVNELNVFPIPDGDTGDNMCLTLLGGVQALKDFSGESLADAAEKIADGMLLSARGNSGVILSQLFYGFAQGLKGLDSADVSDFAKKFKFGVKRAYESVEKPTEGTLLTVAREVSEYLDETADGDFDGEPFLRKLIDRANRSVLETPEKLEVLKKAGVVDSGGAGLYYVLEGLLNYGKDEAVAEDNGTAVESKATGDVDTSKFNENSVLEYGYCSEVLLQLQTVKCDVHNFDLEALRAFLNSIGDSLVLVQTGTIIKIHVHTFTPYKLLEHCQKFGEFLKIKIENMTIQHSEAEIRNRFEVKKDVEKKDFATVVVASGEGIVNLFKDFGADYVIEGGQTDNPSTQDFLDAFEAVNAKTVFVLPNNGNIFLAARQAATLFKDADVRVVDTKNIGDCYAALSMLDYSSGDADTILAGIEESRAGSKTGLISKAIRDTEMDGVTVKNGDYVGFSGKTMLTSKTERLDAVKDLIDKLDNHSEVLVLIYGKEVDESEVESVTAYIKEKHGNLELFPVDGKQDVYDYYVIVQ